MSKMKKNIKCLNCNYEWKTKGKLKMVTCPSCQRKVKLKEVSNLKGGKKKMNKALITMLGILLVMSISIGMSIAQEFPDDIDEMPSEHGKNQGIKWDDVEGIPKESPPQPEPQPSPQSSGGGGSSKRKNYISVSEMRECNDRVYEYASPLIYSYIEFKNLGVNPNPFGFIEVINTIYSSENIKCIKYTSGIIDIIKEAI